MGGGWQLQVQLHLMWLLSALTTTAEVQALFNVRLQELEQLSKVLKQGYCKDNSDNIQYNLNNNKGRSSRC